MKRILTGLFVVFLTYGVARAQNVQAVPGEFIVKYKSSSLSIRTQSSKLAAKADVQKAYPSMGMYHISMKVGPGEAANLEQIKADPDVDFVEPNYIWDKATDSSSVNAQSGTSQTTYSYSDLINNRYAGTDVNTFYQNGLSATRVARSWSQEFSLASKGKVIVAVVDTGLDSNHTLFLPVSSQGAGALWVNTKEQQGVAGIDDDQNGYVDDINGWNFISNTPNFADDDGHGTHVAGIVVGVAQNIFARPLVESKIQIMPLKFLGANGSGTTAAAINAIYYAVNKGAQVINNSWGGSTYSRALHEALAYAYDHQVLVVSAAGNYKSNNDSTPMYPANYDVPSNISVASSSNYDSMSSFSNYGPSTVHIASPGEYILSSYPGDVYTYMSGTSMATPFVAGIAAMAWREDSSMTGYQVKQLIMSSADKANGFNGYISTGARVDFYSLLGAAQSSVGTMSAYQPVYKAQYRSVASDSSSSGGGAGCGLVTTAVLKGPGSGGPNPMAGVISGLLLMPLAVWFVIRRKDPKSRRRHERFRMSSEVRVMVGDRELVGSVNTISQGGLSFNTDEALEKGGIVTMRISSPDGREVIEVQGAVVWNEKNQAYGVQFANARQGTIAMIQQWTQSLVKS